MKIEQKKVVDFELDLAVKLRAYVNDNGDWASALLPDDMLKAADEIERLRRILELENNKENTK